MSNGTHTPHTPHTPRPSHASLSLTEYSANPSPPSSTPKDKTEHAGVPAEFLLPSGYPDVSPLLGVSSGLLFGCQYIGRTPPLCCNSDDQRNMPCRSRIPLTDTPLLINYNDRCLQSDLILELTIRV